MNGNNDITNDSQMNDEAANIDSIINEEIDPEFEAMIDEFVTGDQKETMPSKVTENLDNDDIMIDGKVIPRYLKVEYENAAGIYTVKRAINSEWCKYKIESEGCTVISEFKGIYVPIKYTYKGKEFEVTWNQWNKGKRPHKSLIDLDESIKLIDDKIEDGISVYCYRSFKTKTGFCRKRVFNPEWVYLQFLKEDCELINEYIDGKTKLQYYYIGTDPTVDKEKVYTITFTQWRCKGIRKHLKQYGKNEEFYKQAKAKKRTNQLAQ